MIERMRKLHLIALSYERDRILDVLERTSAAQLCVHAEEEGTHPLPVEGEELRARLFAWEEALDLLSSFSQKYAKEHNVKEFSVPATVSVSYGEFLAARGEFARAEELVAQIGRLDEARAAAANEESRLTRAIAQAEPYRAARAFSSYADTLHTRTRLGLIPAVARSAFENALKELPLAACEGTEGEESVLVAVTAHTSVSAEADRLLGEAGFSPCPYRTEQTGEELLRELAAKRAEAAARRRA